MSCNKRRSRDSWSVTTKIARELATFGLGLLLLSWTQSVTGSYKSNLPAAATVKDGDEFDYIVVGAGAAGCAAAARLSLAGHRVLLLEAGGYPTLLSNIPAAAITLLGSSLDWQYPTIPNHKSCLASRGRQCRFSRGKCLGGSTSINYMLFSRGRRSDYDYYLPGWNWVDLKPYFLRYEGLQVLDSFPPSSRPYHNTTGCVKIEYFDDANNPWQGRIVEGFQSLNVPYNPDINGESQIGVSKVVGYVYEGERMSTARAYLTKDSVNQNLKVAINTLCTGLIIDDVNVIQGITALSQYSNESIRLYAKKEVILSAGTIGSTQILMLSGIGPADHLTSLGIPVRADLPVGDNMSDHVLPLVIVLVDGKPGLASVTPIFNLITKAAEYVVIKEGPLASNGLTDINTFMNTFCYNSSKKILEMNGNKVCESPNLQVINAFVDRGLLTIGRSQFQRGTNLDDATTDQLSDANANKSFIVFSPVLLTPYSRGNIRLNSTDPKDPPAILANYLADERDVDAMLRSIYILEDLMETSPFKDNDATILHIKFPLCPSYKDNPRKYWSCYIRHMTYAVFHATGTCSLNRVVDLRLRVKGIGALRVADASVVPRIPRGNTEAVCIALGERVADFVLEDNRDE